MTRTTLKTTVAVIALTAGTAFAGTDAKVETETEMNVEASVEKTEEYIEEKASDAAAATENAAEATAEAAGDAAQAVEETAENAAAATEQAVEDTAAAAGDVAQDVEETAENAVTETEKAVEETAAAAETTAEDAVEASENGVEAAAAEVSEEANELATEDMVTRAASSDFEGMTVGDLIGLNVYGTNDEDVGEIDYIVRDGDKLAAVIGIGGFLGLGEYTVAIPLEEFSMVSGDMDGLKLSSWTEEELEAQPEFDETGVDGLDSDVRIEDAM